MPALPLVAAHWFSVCGIALVIVVMGIACSDDNSPATDESDTTASPDAETIDAVDAVNVTDTPTTEADINGAADSAIVDDTTQDTADSEDTTLTVDVAPDATGNADADAGTIEPDPGPPEFSVGDGEFAVVILPDTQVYAERVPETFDSQLRWIAEHAEQYNIVFVSHVGDIVQAGNQQNEWQVARAAYDWLVDIDMPHGFSVASHDFVANGNGFDHPHDSSCSDQERLDCDAIDFKRYFGAQFYEDRDWYRGTSPSGLSSYQRVSAEGLELLFLHLPQDTPDAEVEWANEVMDANPGTLAHLTTHRYLFDYRLTDLLPTPLNLLPAGRFNLFSYTLGGQGLIRNDGMEADVLFGNFISRHTNIWSVHCGHVDAEFRQVSNNRAGLPVNEILVDYQDMADGGGGWMRLLIYRPERNLVDVFSISSLTENLRENGDGFEHSVEILTYYRNAYESALVGLGLDTALLDSLIAQYSTPGPEQDAYAESLYAGGARDSQFRLRVDFQAYIDSSR
jgi:hypothetical protein